MTDKEKIMQKYEEWGLVYRIINTELIQGCVAVIQGLEQAIGNFREILTMQDTNEAMCLFHKELAFTSRECTRMLYEALPPDWTHTHNDNNADNDETPF